MKNYSKYICLFLLLLGTGTHAWGNTTVTLSSFGDDTDCTGTWCDGGSFTDNGSNTWTADGYSVSSSRLVIGKGGANYLQTPNFGDNEIKSITVTWYGNTDYYLALQTTDGTELEAIQNPSNVSANPATRTFTVSGSYSQLRLVGRRASGTDNARSTISSVVLVYGPPCANNVTITKGTATNCTFDLSVSGAQASCSGVSTTVTVSPTTGYGTPVVTESGASAEPAITGSGNTWTVAYGENTTSTSTINVACSANDYTVTLNDNSGSGGSGSKTVTFNASTNLTTSVAVPTRTGYTFDGYWTSSNEGATLTTQLVDEDGVWIASVSGYTDASKNWKYAGDLSLYAKWTLNSHTLAIASVANVEISATTPELEEGENTSVNYGATVTLSHKTPDGGRQWGGWNVYKTGDASTTMMVNGDNQFTMPDFGVTVSANLYSDLVFSCSELTLTGPSGDLVFITSTAGKTVRSQEAFNISGTGLTPGATVTFSFGNSALNALFEFKKADGSAPTVSNAEDATKGTINDDIYVFYTPTGTSDGLDEASILTASVSGAKPKSASLTTKTIIGRHLPTDFVIAAKNTNNNKWYALPANMDGKGNPAPVEIAVNDLNNPTIAYTAASNIYNLYTNGTPYYVQLGMKNNVDGSSRSYALWANNAKNSTDIGKESGLAQSSLGSNYQWLLTQTETTIENPQDAKYNISNPNNANMLKLWLAAGGTGVPYWGLYASGISELRLIPASNIIFTEAYFVEWGQHGGVIEVDATGIDATSVVAHLNGASSSAITLSQTQTSGKGRASIYDYTVNFGNDINFAATASNGALLTLEWKNGATTKAMTSLVVPKIIASTSTLSSHGASDGDWSSAEVHVLPGVTLTANAGDFTSNDVMIKHLEIYQGATVVVTKGAQASGTLKVKTLVLRNGWTRAGEKAYDVARLYITPTTASLAKNAPSEDVWYTDWYIDYDQYYPIAVPWKVATATGISYRNSNSAANKGVKIRYYDGALRATNGQQNQNLNWVEYNWNGTTPAMPDNLEPSKGYAMTAKRPTGKAFSIVRMQMTIPSNSWTALGEQGEVSGTHKDQVSVTGYGKGTADWYAMGWNFIGNPYMSVFNGDDDGIAGAIEYQDGGSVRYATIPDLEFKNYYQVPIAEANLKPASAFFIQANNLTPQNVTFNASKIAAPSAPARYTVQQESIPDQEAYIRLSHGNEKDLMGLIIGEDYTEAYEPNADLAKMLGEANAVKTYMRYGDMDMAYVAINKVLARQWIPVTVNLPADGEYTFSLTNSSTVDALEGVYLIDYTNNQITNLIEDNYTFTATAGTISNRFAINATVGERQTPTAIDVVGVNKNGDEPIKFLYHDKVFIWHHGVIYDATGKKVR